MYDFFSDVDVREKFLDRVDQLQRLEQKKSSRILENYDLGEEN